MKAHFIQEMLRTIIPETNMGGHSMELFDLSPPPS